MFSKKVFFEHFFVSLFLIYLHKTYQQDDIIIGTPVLNRSGSKEKKMIGMFTTTMMFRFQVDSNEEISEMFKKVTSHLMNCYFNQKYPYDILFKDFELKKKGYDNLFNTCVNYYNTRLNNEINGLPIENTEFYNGNQIYSLQLVIKDWSDTGRLKLDFDYKVKDYTPKQIERIYTQLMYLSDQILNGSCTTINQLRVISKADMNRILFEYNSSKSYYPKNTTIYRLFEEQAQKTPDNIAICYGDEKLTYRVLNEKANQLARYLIKKGVNREAIIGLITTHSIESVIGILGILKAGAAYLPIDPEYPEDRIKYMLDDCKISIILTNGDMAKELDYKGQVINLELAEIYTGETCNLDFLNEPDDLVYVIYTSGSTGKPKGTMVEHRGLVNYIWWAKQMYTRGEKEVFPFYSSLAFDLTVTSIFTPIICGGRIEVYSNDDDEYVLYRIMRENKSTVIKLTPSHLCLLKDIDNSGSSVKRFIVGGEDLKVKVAKEVYDSFNGDIEIYNEYGPTETVVGCMIHKYDPNADQGTSVPIGKPAHNVQIYLLDSKLEPVPPGATGEIFISGDGVSRGYINMPELTSERFIANPFIDGKSLYKTGDLGRFNDDNIIEYVGRADRQVKLRGYRIELGEIEKAILLHKYVKDAIVTIQEDKQKNKVLCAYIVEDKRISEEDIREFLMVSLPSYMIPQYIVWIDKIQLTSNGKIDFEMLPKPYFNSFNQEVKNIQVSGLEEIIYKVVSEVLELNSVGEEDNFYYLGGDSIKAIQIAAKLNNIGLKVRVKDILANPILKQVASLVKDHRNLNKSDNELCCGNLKLTPIVSWFFSREFINQNYYNQSVMLELKKQVGVKELESAIDQIIKYHDSLRLNYNPLTNELFYNNRHMESSSRIKVFDLSNLSHEEQCEKIVSIEEQIKSGFNIEKDLLINSCVFDLGPAGKKLLLTAHHLVVDGVSWRIILEDLENLLRAKEGNINFEFPQKTCSYKKWSEALIQFSESEAVQETEYWNSILEKNFSFPTDNITAVAYQGECIALSDVISEKDTKLLLSKANRAYNTETKDLLITALSLAINKYTGKNSIVIEVEGHGREEIFDEVDITRTVGWFTSIYPIAFEINGEELPQTIKNVKEQLRKVPNKGIGFGVLKYMSPQIQSNGKRFIRFNYLGDMTGISETEYFSISNGHISIDTATENQFTCLVEINAMVIDNCLKVTFIYNKEEFKKDSIKRFAELYMDSITKIIEHCSSKESVSFTPSDFETIDLLQDELDLLFL
nr:amino acid adenylation domain-containing protein [Ruminiclostridium josui]